MTELKTQLVIIAVSFTEHDHTAKCKYMYMYMYTTGEYNIYPAPRMSERG